MTHRTDVLTGTVLVGMCALGFYATTFFREVPASLSQNVPPTFFPRLVLAVMAILSVSLVVLGSRRPGTQFEKPPRSVLVTAVLLSTAVVLLPYLGMLVTVLLVAIVLPLYWGERRTVSIAALALGLPLAIHLIFGIGLRMRFPKGILW